MAKRKLKNIEHIMDNLKQQHLNIDDNNNNNDDDGKFQSTEQLLSSSSNNAIIQSIHNDFLQRKLMDNQQQQPEQQQQQQQSNNNSSSSSSSIYRGLYPINDVKQFFSKTIINGRKHYKCLYEKDCTFSTWNYSQHISRHIYLKHIGIKKLQCNHNGCDRMFKRPESLVNHIKNHNCGFGIDNDRMRDPNNVCGIRNIRKYFTRQLDNDYY
ncbi:hypothetical protein BLA29_010018, partial [Euroglyphus maynei]